jgi:hypothetical protein
MVFDSEQQKNVTLQLIDQAQINGAYSQVLQTIQVLTQFRQEVQNAKVGVHSGAGTGEAPIPAS